MRFHGKNIGIYAVSMLIVFTLMVSTSISSSSITLKQGKDSFYQSITLDNTPPNPPEINGPATGKTRESILYTITLTDPDYDDILLNLEINWGDGTEGFDCGCGKSWRNGTIVNISHSWIRTGDFSITARIQDSYGAWSNWSEPLPISIPKQKTISTVLTPFIQSLWSLSQIRSTLFPFSSL